MAIFTNPSSRLERAVRALLILQGKGVDSAAFSANGDTFIANDSRTRSVLPNRTVFAPRFTPTRPYRPEGVCHLQVEHHFSAALQPDDANLQQRRVDADAYLGQTLATFGINDGSDDQAMGALAAAITVAGRWLATPDPNNPLDPNSQAIVNNNLDMLAFRCDWVKNANPFVTRGQAGEEGSNWVEILNFECFVSTGILYEPPPNQKWPTGSYGVPNAVYEGSPAPNGFQFGNVGDIYNQIVNGVFVAQWEKVAGNGNNVGWQ